MLHRDDVFQFTARSDLREQAAKLRKMPNINGEDKITRLFEKKDKYLCFSFGSILGLHLKINLSQLTQTSFEQYLPQ